MIGCVYRRDEEGDDAAVGGGSFGANLRAHFPSFHSMVSADFDEFCSDPEGRGRPRPRRSVRWWRQRPEVSICMNTKWCIRTTRL